MELKDKNGKIVREGDKVTDGVETWVVKNTFCFLKPEGIVVLSNEFGVVHPATVDFVLVD